MLHTLEIENFRCFKKHTVPFRENTVVVGQNNAGKSTLIEALRLVALAQTRYRTLQYEGPPSWLDGVGLKEPGVTPSIERFDLSPEGLFYRYSEPPARIGARFRNGTRLDVYVGPGFQLFVTVHKSKIRPVYSRTEALNTHVPDMAVMPQLTLPLDRERLLTAKTVREGMGFHLASHHFRNEILLLKENYYDDFRKLAELTWPGLQIQRLEQSGSASEPVLSLTVRDGPFVAELAWMGSGLKMWIQIMWFLAWARPKRVIVLDEPDIHMHPDLQRKLAHLTSSMKAQTILTTHSVELLSEIDPNDVLVLDKSQLKSEFATKVTAVQNALDSMGSGQSVMLMRLWTAKKFLLVEGKDVPLLSKFQSVLFPNSPVPFGAVPSQSIGGWNGWQRAIGAAGTLQNAAGDRIRVYCILDSDYQTETALASREKDAKQSGIDLHIWSHNELESYFLVPEAIARTINEEIEEGVEQVSVAKVEDALDAIAEELKSETVDMFATQYQLADKKAGVAAANQRARARVAASWGTLRNKVKIVPGKDSFSRLSKWTQNAYSVSLSLGAVARKLEPGEIDPEVAKVVTAIERGAPIG